MNTKAGISQSELLTASGGCKGVVEHVVTNKQQFGLGEWDYIGDNAID